MLNVRKFATGLALIAGAVVVAAGPAHAWGTNADPNAPAGTCTVTGPAIHNAGTLTVDCDLTGYTGTSTNFHITSAGWAAGPSSAGAYFPDAGGTGSVSEFSAATVAGGHVTATKPLGDWWEPVSPFGGPVTIDPSWGFFVNFATESDFTTGDVSDHAATGSLSGGTAPTVTPTSAVSGYTRFSCSQASADGSFAWPAAAGGPYDRDVDVRVWVYGEGRCNSDGSGSWMGGENRGPVGFEPDYYAAGASACSGPCWTTDPVTWTAGELVVYAVDDWGPCTIDACADDGAGGYLLPQGWAGLPLSVTGTALPEDPTYPASFGGGGGGGTTGGGDALTAAFGDMQTKLIDYTTSGIGVLVDLMLLAVGVTVLVRYTRRAARAA